jgi:phosphomethylpyrimidine synthase
MRMSHEHERANGRDWVDNHQDCPEGELRGQATLVKITEDVRKYAAEQSLAEDVAIERGLEEKAKEFVEKGAEVYAKA